MSDLDWKRAIRSIVPVLALGIVLGLTMACQKNAVSPQAAAPQPQRAAVPPPTAPGPAVAESATERQVERPYAYEPLGKRDPFRSFVLDRLKDVEVTAKGPLEQFELSQLAVLGIVWDTDNARALISDPSGQGYIVSHMDPIGKNEGRVIQIGDNSVVVRETYVDYVGEKTTKEIEMRVRQSQGG